MTSIEFLLETGTIVDIFLSSMIVGLWYATADHARNHTNLGRLPVSVAKPVVPMSGIINTQRQAFALVSKL